MTFQKIIPLIFIGLILASSQQIISHPNLGIDIMSPFQMNRQKNSVFVLTRNNDTDDLPDLVITRVDASDYIFNAGEIIDISVWMRNEGRIVARNFTTSLLVDGNPIKESDVIETLNPEEEISYNFTWKVKEGERRVGSYVDYDNEIVESNEENNTKSILIQGTSTRSPWSYYFCLFIIIGVPTIVFLFLVYFALKKPSKKNNKGEEPTDVEK